MVDLFGIARWCQNTDENIRVLNMIVWLPLRIVLKLLDI